MKIQPKKLKVDKDYMPKLESFDFELDRALSKVNPPVFKVNKDGFVVSDVDLFLVFRDIVRVDFVDVEVDDGAE